MEKLKAEEASKNPREHVQDGTSRRVGTMAADAVTQTHHTRVRIQLASAYSPKKGRGYIDTICVYIYIFDIGACRDSSVSTEINLHIGTQDTDISLQDTPYIFYIGFT